MKRYTAGEVIDKYKIISVLGEGGIGIVYRAEHTLLGTDVALKMCKLQNAHAQERLRIEGRAQTKLKHPNIVSVYDMIVVDHSPCLIMEYVSGVGLDEWLRTRTISTKEAETLFIQILDAMELAHNQNIIHRDLKPSNIMITEINGRPFAKVCDFGLAKIQQQAGPNLTRTGAMMGTPAYMAPEQIRNAKESDHRADVFSLGAIYYELLTGTMAFTGSDTLELLNSVANEPHRPPSELIPDLEKRHNSALQGALTKNPDFRIPNCATFRSVLLGEETWTDAKELVAQHDTLLGDGEQTLEFIRPQTKKRPEDDEKTELMTRAPQQASINPPEPQSTLLKADTAPKQHSTPKVEYPSVNEKKTTSVPALLYLIVISHLRLLGGILMIFIVLLYGFSEDSESPSTEPPPIIQNTMQAHPPKEIPPKKIVSEETRTNTEATIQSSSDATKQKTQTATSTKEKTKVFTKPEVKTKTSIKNTTTKSKVATQTNKSTKEETKKTATVSFSGADGLILKGEKGTFQAGKVPVGSYKVYGIFKDREIPVGNVTLKANQKKHFICTKTLRCN